jgi:hypothetical protein
VNLTFTPLSSGTRNGTLTIQHNAASNPHTMSLTGAGTTTPLVITPLSADLGPQRLGITSAPQTISIANVGGTIVHVASIATPPYFQQTNNCTTIQPDAACQLLLTFTPLSSGTVGGTITIQDDGFGSPRSISLSGTGVQPALSLDRNALTFPSTRVSAASSTQFVTVMNPGNTSMLLQDVATAGDFSLTNGCSSLVPASGSCFLIVTFRPTASGTRGGEIVLNDDAPGSPHRVSLTGTGRALALNLLPSSLSYATQTVGSNSAAQTILVTNDTSTIVNLASIVINGDYSQTNNCPQQLTPDSSCSIDVVFSPKSAGTRTGALAFTGSTGVYTVALSGTGAASAVSISSSSFSFAPTLLGGASTQDIIITSTGAAPLAISTPTITGFGFSYLSSCPASLASGHTCTITVRFTPSSPGVSQGSLRLIDDAPGSPRTIALSGTGLEFSINPRRPQRSDRNVPAVKPTQSRAPLRPVPSRAQASSSAGAVLGTFSTSTDLALNDHTGSNAGGRSRAPYDFSGKPVSSNLNTLCGSTATGDGRRVAPGNTKTFLSSDQDVAVLRADVDPALVGNDVEAGGTLVDRFDFEAIRLQPEAGGSCDGHLPSDQLGEIAPIPNPAQAEHAKRSPRQ